MIKWQQTPFIRFFEIQSCSYDAYRHPPLEPILVNVISRAVSLVTLKIGSEYRTSTGLTSRSQTLAIIPRIASHCPALQHLDIALPDAVDTASTRHRLLSLCGCRQLSTLRLRFHSGLGLGAAPDALLPLVELLPALLRGLESLRALTARNLPTCRVAPWPALASETLRELDLSSSKDLCAAMSPGARVALPALETLNLAWTCRYRREREGEGEREGERQRERQREREREKEGEKQGGGRGE